MRRQGGSCHAELPRRLDAPMPGQDPVFAVNQHRIGEAKTSDAFGDLPDLLARMGSGIARPEPQLVEGEDFYGVSGHGPSPFDS
jgi:hypothetical protein